MNTYLLIGISILFALNIAVSVYVGKRDDLERFQKVAQIILVWLIPFLMAVVVYIINRGKDNPLKAESRNHSEAPSRIDSNLSD